MLYHHAEHLDHAESPLSLSPDKSPGLGTARRPTARPRRPGRTCRRRRAPFGLGHCLRRAGQRPRLLRGHNERGLPAPPGGHGIAGPPARQHRPGHRGKRHSCRARGRLGRYDAEGWSTARARAGYQAPPASAELSVVGYVTGVWSSWPLSKCPLSIHWRTWQTCSGRVGRCCRRCRHSAPHAPRASHLRAPAVLSLQLQSSSNHPRPPAQHRVALPSVRRRPTVGCAGRAS